MQRRAVLATMLSVLAGACAPMSAPVRPADSAVATAPVERTDGADTLSAILGRDWIFVEIAGLNEPLPSPPPVAGFIMTREGRFVRGTTACNGMSAGYEIDPDAGRLRFVKLRNRRQLCDRVAADTEEAVLDAMIRTDSFQLSGNTLVLYAHGEFVARLVSPD